MKVKGVYEKLEGNIATIDGQKVQFDPNCMIEGAKDWKKMEFHSFNEMMLGSFVVLEGRREEDRIVYITSGKTFPNNFTPTEQMLKAALRENLGFLEDSTRTPEGIQKIAQQFPGLSPTHLSNNQVVIGGNQFPLLKDFEVQAYINKIGFKLIPSYIRQVS